MNTDGTNQTNISNDDDRWDAFPSWSPDGTKIVFTARRGGNHQIYVMNTDGTNPTRLTNNDAEDEYPSWSPDGTKIAFTSDRDGNYEIYVMDYVSS
jgi:Tol biopolymer transport system component